MELVDKGTVTAELHLYCDSRNNDRIIIQSGTGVGNLLGILFCAILSDRKGRKFSFVISSVLLNVGFLSKDG
jgi:MFS family permease